MGSISSVYISNDSLDNAETNELNFESVSERNAISLIKKEDSRKICQKVVKVELNHSLSVPDDMFNQSSGTRKEHMGITIQYLAEENVRLVLTNKRLVNELENLSKQLNSRELEYDDRDAIYGESLENRLCRLEKLLASERQEKWLAIENNERTRVDLVNCERELSNYNQKVETLQRSLEEKINQIDNLEKLIEEIKDVKRKEVDEESSEESQVERKASMAEFRADLKAKREARQKALAVVSQELSRLREELQKEKLERQRLERELEDRNEASSMEQLLSDNASLKNEIFILTDNLEKVKDFSTENIRLKYETKRLNEEMDLLNSSLGELKFEYYDEKRKHERTQRRLKEMEEEKERYVEMKKEWDEEREKMFERYDREKEEINRRTVALREVIAITKQMLAIRESQVDELKTKMKDIESSVKTSMLMDEDGLKAEYAKQLENIKHLRELYEERVRLMEAERERLNESLKEKSQTLESKDKDIEDLANQIESSKEETKAERQEKENFERELRLMIARSKDLENELSLINNMFTQMLLGPYNSGNETDLDKLTELLQENHDLIAVMTTKEDSSEIASVLPKLLLDLITQVDGMNGKDEDLPEPESCDTISQQSESLLEENQDAVLPILSYKNATLFKPPKTDQDALVEDIKPSEETKINEQISPAVQEIASNLPKVWKVLTELLSHHSAPEEPTPGDEKQCYKNVETPNGPRTVISVSKTFIRLKDLILEKKALQKELTRLKQLNSHLETRLDDQEKRLSQVQCELHKTWGIVGRMKAQHQQLHNHEKILRYELQEKRVMLSELKQELEYCRDKWERARQKNDESETEWKKLRREFAARKSKGYLLSNLNDSGESGFSDEQNESGEECENFDADRSSTQSPVDQKLLVESTEHNSESPEKTASNLAEKIIKQSEINLQQTKESVEHTNLEECVEVNSQTKSTTSKVHESNQEDERARAREARDLRLKKLEEQCKLLVRQVDITTHKSNYLNNRLEELHEQYGSQEENRRQIKTNTSEESQSCSVVASQKESGEQSTSSTTNNERTDCEDDKKPKTTLPEDQHNQ